MDETAKVLKDLIDNARLALLTGSIPEQQRRQLHDAAQRGADHLRALRSQHSAK